MSVLPKVNSKPWKVLVSRMLYMLLFSVILSSGCIGRLAERPETLFQTAPALDEAAKDDPLVIRSRAVTANTDLLPAAGDKQPGEINLNLFEDTAYLGLIEQVDRNSSGGVTISGVIKEQPYGRFILVFQENQLAGRVWGLNQAIGIRYSGKKDIHVITEYDPEAFPGDAPILKPRPDSSRGEAESKTKLDDGSIIDVMVVYTEDARQASGGVISIQNRIQMMIAFTNQTYQDSGINQRLNLVHTGEVNYSGTGDIQEDLVALAEQTDSEMNEVHTWRDTYCADVVTLIEDYNVAATGYCGMSLQLSNVSTTFAPFAFNIVDDLCGFMSIAYPHELGHNMGARHDWYMDSQTLPYDYAHGYVDLTSGWRTIMAYKNACTNAGVSCPVLSLWSNPDRDYEGAALGVPHTDPEPADNVTTLNNTASTVANFRASCSLTGDVYEVDDISSQASVIEPDQPQTHSILPVADQDWVIFQLTEESGVSIATSGTGASDTRLYLYDANLAQLDFDDNSGVDGYSEINRYCGYNALPAGTYYVLANEMGDDDLIPSYTLALSEVVSCATALPEIMVTGEGVEIPNGDTTPAETDKTVFQTIDLSGGVRGHGFRIENEGTAAVLLTGDPKLEFLGPHDVDFRLQSPENIPDFIGPGEYALVMILFDPVATGQRTSVVSIANNDADENPYTFTVQGTATGQDSPEIAIKSENGSLIADGDWDPSALDGTYFGEQDALSGASSAVFEIWNYGGLALNLTGDPLVRIDGYQAADFSVTIPPAAAVVSPWNGVLPFEVTFDPTGVGLRTAIVSVYSDDADENPYAFRIEGVGLGAEFPEIEVHSHDTGSPIPNGDSTPSLNETDFGSAEVALGITRRYFRIFNEGTVPLQLPGDPRVEILGPHSLDFTVSQPIRDEIAPGGGSTGFHIDFRPIGSGLRTAVVSIANSDTDENPYTFTIQGTGTGQDYPEIALESASGEVIADGDEDPDLGDGTDFGTVELGGEPLVHTFRIINHGGATLELSGSPQVEISGLHAGDFSITAQPASSTVSIWGGEVTFEVAFTPTDLGLRSAVISIANNDLNEHPYTFAIQGSGQVKIPSPDPQDTQFGRDVSLWGEIALVGAPSADAAGAAGAGAVYVVSNRPGSWEISEMLTANDAAQGDLFGASIAYVEGFALVGAPGDDDHGQNSGAVYIFKDSGGVWQRQEKLLPDSDRAGAGFGAGVDVSGNLAAVTAVGSGSVAPEVYLFKYQPDAWQYAGKLTPPVNVPGAAFGAEVSLDGSRAAVSGTWTAAGGQQQGAVFIFTTDGYNWSYETMLQPDNGSLSHLFGSSLELSGDAIIVGDPGNDQNGENSGAVYLFSLVDGVWSQVARLTPSQAGEGERFGAGVALEGDLAVVSDLYDNVEGEIGSESLFVFQRPDQGWLDMTESARLFSWDGEAGELTFFGESLAISEGVILSAAPEDREDGQYHGAVYLLGFGQ